MILWDTEESVMEDLIEVTAGLEGDLSSVNTTPKGKQNLTMLIAP